MLVVPSTPSNPKTQHHPAMLPKDLTKNLKKEMDEVQSCALITFISIRLFFMLVFVGE